jgi:2-polyprenyl-6-methoxyphenol hydroxylase-like FAD-dependent oxidoreductase
MKPEHDQTVDVLVVGAGPSGLTVSAALARAGIRTLTIERHPGTSIFPKATGIRLRTMEILRSWGLDDLLPDQSADVRMTMSVSPTLAGPQLQEVPLGVPEDGTTDDVSPSRFAFCAQDVLEPIVLDHVREHGGEVRFGTELVTLQVHAGGATAQLRTLTSGSTYVVSARYVVGADGGGSTVREAAGIGWHHLGTEGHHLSMLVRADLSAALGERTHALHATVAPGAEALFVATGERDRWLFDVEWQPEDGDTVADWTPERVRDAVRASSGLPDVEPTVEGVFPWEFGAAVADTQRAGPVFLVGDAAHRTTPRRSTGMNTGIADAHNLGWKLAWVVRGWAGPKLLDSYDEERRPVGLANARRSLVPAVDDGEKPNILADDLGVTYRSAVVDDSDAESPHAEARPGERAPHAWVERDGGRLSLLDLYDGRLTVVTARGGTAWRVAADQLAADGLPLEVVELGRDVRDADGHAAARYGVQATSAVLVRPDGHVAARLRGAPSQASALLDRAVDRALGRKADDSSEAIAG